MLPSRRNGRSLALLLGLALGTSACGPYDPARDRKIPREPKLIEWTHELTIAAPPEQVWAVLTDFDSYTDWNPWLVYAEGPAELGARVDIGVVLDGKRRDMWHRVTLVDAPRRFCWRDGGPTTGFATGQRCRELEPDGHGGTRFRVILDVGGSFRNTVEKRYGAQLQAAMEEETAALAQEAQRRAKLP